MVSLPTISGTVGVSPTKVAPSARTRRGRLNSKEIDPRETTDVRIDSTYARLRDEEDAFQRQEVKTERATSRFTANRRVESAQMHELEHATFGARFLALEIKSLEDEGGDKNEDDGVAEEGEAVPAPRPGRSVAHGKHPLHGLVFLHISKAGGTSFCQLAHANHVRGPEPVTGRAGDAHVLTILNNN